MEAAECGGEAGIRTLGGREASTVFETAAFDHSATSPVNTSLSSPTVLPHMPAEQAYSRRDFPIQTRTAQSQTHKCRLSHTKDEERWLFGKGHPG
jgi:hypothetical protein